MLYKSPVDFLSKKGRYWIMTAFCIYFHKIKPGPEI